MIAERVSFFFKRLGPPECMLAAVGLAELILCVTYHQQRWDSMVVPRALRAQRTGEGLVIQWNGLGYYAWLRSLLVDHDWDFDNEFDNYNPHNCYVPPRCYRTPLGRRANQWSVGPACLWAVTVVPGHFLIKVLHGSRASLMADGYSLPYQLLVGATSLLVTVLGLGLIYGACRTQARSSRAALATALLTLGTTVVYFNAIEISLPHGLGTAVLAGLVYYWLSTYGSLRPTRWFIVGMLVGAAALVRWQLVTFAVLPAVEVVFSAIRRRQRASALAALAASAAVVTFLPQLIAWRCVYGSWLVSPIQAVHYHWLQPSLWTILFSQDRSLFYWTPLTVVFCVGAYVSVRQPNSLVGAIGHSSAIPWVEPLFILLLGFVIQVWTLAGIWGKGELLENTGNFAGVFLARSFGFRDLTESLVVLAPGLAWFLEHTKGPRFHALAGLGLLLVVWNLLLVRLYIDGMIPATEGASPWTLIHQSAELVRNKPLAVLEALEFPLLIGLFVVFTERKR